MAKTSKRARNSEVDAYIFIKEGLENLGWNTKNPSRDLTGQVYTQQECQHHSEIKKYLGRETPENIIKISETAYWVIEAKKEHKNLQKAIDEAKDYANKINKSTQIKALFISGIAGNRTDSFLVETEFLCGKRWEKVTINGKKASGLLKLNELKTIISQNSADIKDIIIDEDLFFQKAERINEILHLGAINKNYRARVIAAILLSLIDENPLNIDATPKVLIQDINARVENVLENEDKVEFKDMIKIALPPSSDNHIKFKKALVQTIQELSMLNIRSAMNSGTDILGKFYEVFLKYGNGAKEIGIVLTPRHITKFATEVIDIKPNDIIFDPTCGTGGFLVSAFDHVKKTANKQQINTFKERNIFGIEQEPEVVALAIVNMIFRGDGKNNLIEGNCFQKNLTDTGRGIYYTKDYSPGDQVITKVLMNPPFALKNSDEKEYKFVDYALSQMQDGGILFSILPYSAMSKSSGYDQWRKELIQKNTLLSVITFPEDLFYPIGVFTVGIFVKKGIPHPADQKVLWIRALNDGFLKKKGRKKFNPKARNDFLEIQSLLRAFLVDQTLKITDKAKFIKATLINRNDPRLELVPEVYLDDNQLTRSKIDEEMKYLIREVTSFKIKYNQQLFNGK